MIWPALRGWSSSVGSDNVPLCTSHSTRHDCSVLDAYVVVAKLIPSRPILKGLLMRFALLTLFAAVVLAACSDDSTTSPDDSELQTPAVGSVFNLTGWRFKEKSTGDSLPGTTAAFVMTIVEKNISYEGKSGVWKTIITDVRTGRDTDTLYMCYDANKDLLLLDPRRMAEINATLPAGVRRLSWIRLPLSTKSRYRDTIITSGVFDGKQVQRRLLVNVEVSGGGNFDFGSGDIFSFGFFIRLVDELNSTQGSVPVQLKAVFLDEYCYYAPKLGVLTERTQQGYSYAGKVSDGRYFELLSYTLK